MWVCHRRCRLACWHVVVCGYYTLVSVGSLLHVGVPSSVSACMLAYCCMRLLHTCQWWLLVACGCAIVGVGLHVGLLLYAVITQASVLAHCCMLACYCMRLLHKCQCWLIVACWLVIVCGYYTSVSVGSLLHVGMLLYSVITQVSVLAHCCMWVCHRRCRLASWLVVKCGCTYIVVSVGLDARCILLFQGIRHSGVVWTFNCDQSTPNTSTHSQLIKHYKARTADQSTPNTTTHAQLSKAHQTLKLTHS